MEDEEEVVDAMGLGLVFFLFLLLFFLIWNVLKNVKVLITAFVLYITCS